MASQPVTWFLVYPGNQQQVIQQPQQQQLQQQLQQQHQQMQQQMQHQQQQQHIQLQYQQPQHPHLPNLPSQQQQPQTQHLQQPQKQKQPRQRKKPAQQPQKQGHHQQSMPPKSTCRQSHQENSNDWVCVLCHKICHYRCLGDLFGPYTIDFSVSDDTNCSTNIKKKTPSGQKSDDGPTSTKIHCSTNSSNNGTDSSINMNTGGSSSYNTTSSITPPKAKKSRYSLLNHNIATSNSKKSSSKEIWIHEDCLIWSDGVHIVGNKIRAMEEVIRDSLNNKCAACKTTGATIGCVGKRCRRKYHYICAVNSHCHLDEASFTLNCVGCLLKKERPKIEPM